MKNIYSIKNLIVFLCFLGTILPSLVTAQVVKPFTNRTQLLTPNRKIYNLRGDYAMIGNSNLTTTATLTNTSTNSNISMSYIDTDGNNTTVNSSMSTLTFNTENGALPACTKVVYAGLYWTGRTTNGNNNTSSPLIYNVNQTRTLHKQVVRLRGPGAVSYDSITASSSNIHFPLFSGTGNQDGIYVGYSDITSYVQTHGLGEYWVADVACATGNGGDVGFFGGWTMVVIYENTKMEWRDITVFDGFGYMDGSNTSSHILPVKGFKARQNGPVNVKMGMMAAEGDVSIPNDYFRIWNQTTNSFQNLSHSTNLTNNFFNSSINVGTGATRNPSNQNNTGIDVAMFNLNNTNFDYIRHDDDSTTFEFGSNQDTYVIPLIVFGVDAYIPDIAPINQLTYVNSNQVTGNQIVNPGDTVTYQLVVMNTGAETIIDAEMQIAIPFAADYLDHSVNYYLNTGNRPNPAHQSGVGVNGSIYWGVIDSIPRPTGTMNDTFAVLTYRFTATKDCYILMNPMCQPTLLTTGFAKGTGKISLIPIDSLPFIFGHQQTGSCLGDPILQPQIITIDGTTYVNNNCGVNENILRFVACGANATGVYPLANVVDNYPAGSRYYNEFPVTNNSIEYTVATGFPYTANGIADTFYAVPPTGSNECVFLFTITGYRSPVMTNYTYNCLTAEVQVYSSELNTTFRVDTVYASPTYWAAITKPAPNVTGYFNGLKGADSMIVTLITGGECLSTYSLTFEDCGAPLPVEFVNFTAVKNNTLVDLNWVVAKEEQVAQYIVERSIDGRVFEEIHTQKPSSTTAITKTYKAVDQSPNIGINYYRIKQVDIDGSKMYSTIRIVNFEDAHNLNVSLYPNPNNGIFNLNIESNQNTVASYWITNNLSQTVSAAQEITLEKGTNTIKINVQHLSDGVYFVGVKSDNATAPQFLKFVKKSGK